MHRRSLEACRLLTQYAGLESVSHVQSMHRCVPEYPQSPTHHLNRPTIINTIGMMIHCDVLFLAGQKKAARGKVGIWLFVFGSMTVASSRLGAMVLEVVFCFFRGRCGVESAAIEFGVQSYHA